MKSRTVVCNGNIVTISGEILNYIESSCPEGTHSQTLLRKVAEVLNERYRQPIRPLCTAEKPCSLCRESIEFEGGIGTTDGECPLQGFAVVLLSGEVVETSALFGGLTGWSDKPGSNIFSLFPGVSSHVLGGLFRDTARTGEPILMRNVFNGGSPEFERVLYVQSVFLPDQKAKAYRITAAPAYNKW